MEETKNQMIEELNQIKAKKEEFLSVPIGREREMFFPKNILIESNPKYSKVETEFINYLV